MSALQICVTVKQVPDTAEVRIDPETHSLMREGVPSIVNPEDLVALEAALQLREACGGSVTALSMGPPQARAALETALAMGADRAVLLSDRAFAGSDTLITAFALSRAIEKLGTVDLVLCGRQAIDGDTAQVGPQIAGFLDLPQVTCAEALSLQDGCLVVRRALEDCIQEVSVRLPALVALTAAGPAPRHPALFFVERACDEARLTCWGAVDLGIPEKMLGLQASPTGVQRIFEPERITQCEFLSGDGHGMTAALLERLQQRNLL